MKLLFVLSFVSLVVFGQDLPEVTQAEVAALFQSIGGLKGAGTLGVVAFVVQALMLGARSFLAGLLGKYKLLVVLLLTMVGGVLGLLTQGVELGAALVHSSTLAAAQVLLHQVYKEFIEKK